MRLALDESTPAEDRLAQIEGWLSPYTNASARTLTAFQQLLGSEITEPASWKPPASKYHRPDNDAERAVDASAPAACEVDE